jgi:hypothetical protein
MGAPHACCHAGSCELFIHCKRHTYAVRVGPSQPGDEAEGVEAKGDGLAASRRDRHERWRDPVIDGLRPGQPMSVALIYVRAHGYRVAPVAMRTPTVGDMPEWFGWRGLRSTNRAAGEAATTCAITLSLRRPPPGPPMNLMLVATKPRRLSEEPAQRPATSSSNTVS